MSKADNYIREHTRHCSNSYWDKNDGESNYPWITPDDARKAVEIAKKEIYKWLANHYRDYMHNPTGEKLEAFFGGDMINNLKEVMGDE